MKQKKQKINSLYLTFGLVMLSGAVMHACGRSSGPDYNDPRYYSNYYQNVNGVCQIPQGIKDRTVVGNLGNGATIKLDIFTQSPGNNIAAFGQLSIPSLESLFGTNVPSNPFPTTPTMVGNGYAGPNTAFTTCISTNGFTGTLERDSSIQNINLSLMGNGNTFIEMGTAIGPYTAYLGGDALQGTVNVTIGSYPKTPFIMAQ